MSKDKKEIKQEEEIKEEKKEEAKEEKPSETDLLKKEIEELKKKVQESQSLYEKADREKDDWKNKYYEAYADMANLRKQVQKECDDAKKYASKSFVEELIPTLDSFDYALKNPSDDPKIKQYVQGFEMIHSKMINTLTQLGVSIISPEIGSEYDPHKMQAFSTVDGEEDNKIAEVYCKGYALHEHLLRPAGVIVTAKAVVEEEKKEDTKAEDSKESENK